ncbi:GerAB/ArcD/ProY family transporter [Ignavigranum ruoffiae]|jgi:aromatic amino acid permease|uniref:GerAB/ArcD/ProY family transporter n=1 Tax=Ignavigranum ruoffiae TaxID=89093 RepID=UPI003B5948CD
MKHRRHPGGTVISGRQLFMVGLGSGIGSGLFLGTGSAVHFSGSFSILFYIVGGALTVCIVYAMSQLVDIYPRAKSFTDFFHYSIGSVPALSVGALYWSMLLVVMSTELIGASLIFSNLVGISPLYFTITWALLVPFILLRSASSIGRFETVSTLVKLIFILIFIFLACYLLSVNSPLLPSDTFIQHPISSIPHNAELGSGFLTIFFSFGGVEIAVIAGTNTSSQTRSNRIIIISTLIRILVFYIAVTIALMLLVPSSKFYPSQNIADSPFSYVLQSYNLSSFTTVFDALIAITFVSAFTSQLYAASKTLHSLSCIFHEGFSRKVAPPRSGLSYSIVSSIFTLCVSMLSLFGPKYISDHIFSFSGGALLITWCSIAICYTLSVPKIRKKCASRAHAARLEVLRIVLCVSLTAVALVALINGDSRLQVLTSLFLLCAFVLAFWIALKIKVIFFKRYSWN